MKQIFFLAVFIVSAAVIAGGAFYFARRKLRNKTFILYYHKINNFKAGGLKSLFVRPSYFDFQMRYLRWRGYRTISLEELAQILKSGGRQPLPQKVFVITFDDGYRDNFTNAYPVLKKYGFRATVFLVYENIGRSAGYPGEPSEEHMSQDEVRSSADVFDFGSHTLSHQDLRALNSVDRDDMEKLEAEIAGSRDRLSRLPALSGKRIDTFCYPFGRITADADRLVRENYIAACTTQSGLVSKDDDPYLLRRVEWKDLFTMSFRSFFKAWEFYLKILIGV